MDIAKRIVAAFLILSAIAVGLLLMLTPVFHDGSPDYPAWKILNWFMAVGVIVSLAVSFKRRRAHLTRGGEINVDYLRAGLVWYGAIALTALFFWEWFWTLNPDSETGEAVTSHMVYFPIVDVLYMVVSISSGRYLLSGGRVSEG